MPFALPSADHPARQHLDMEHLVEVLAPHNVGRLPTFREAIRRAQETISVNGAIRSVTTVCLRADDERWLIEVGPRGGWKKLWSFGNGR